MSKIQDYQNLIREYKRVTGETEIDMKKVAKFGVDKFGIELPPPSDPLDQLAKKIAIAARERTRVDKKTGRPYRANHAVVYTKNGVQQSFWVDIDEATRPQMHRSIQKRREQIVGDAYHMDLDLEHWNSINPMDNPIQMSLDLTDDVAERKSLDQLDDAS